MELEVVAKLCQKCTGGSPVLVLGSGASAPHGIKGMPELADYLLSNIKTTNTKDSDDWLLVKTALSNGDHLEEALEKNTLSHELLDQIVRCTWDFITSFDRKLFLTTAANNTEYPLRRLFDGLFQTTNRNIHVITTNYDRVVEYAADSGGYIHHTGFLPGYIRRSAEAQELTFKLGMQPARTVTIWKPHGSLDWFSDKTGQTLSLPLSSDLPKSLTPLIVTPGVSKFERTYQEPFRSAIQGADRVLMSASAIICIGYGFRDTHIHPKIVNRCKTHDIPILVIAKELTPEARTFLRDNGGKHYVALEEAEDGTKVYCRDAPDGVFLPGKQYWQLAELNNLVGF